MSTVWQITCLKCGHRESFRTGRSTEGAEGEREQAENRAKDPCPQCGSTEREFRT